MLLKPNMVLPGTTAAKQASDEEVAEATRAVLPRDRARGGARHRVPVGRSVRRGGDRATSNAMNKLGPHPWQLSFSYGRALQAPR